MIKNAILSECKKYRYYLTRQWDENLSFVNFIGLNPSTADAQIDDQTIYKCIRYAQRWGYGGIIMTNLFAYRSSKPTKMMSYSGDKIGKENDSYILKGKQDAALSVAAWGDNGVHENRWQHVVALFENLYCLKISAIGQPRHPLSRLKDDIDFIDYNIPSKRS